MQDAQLGQNEQTAGHPANHAAIEPIAVDARGGGEEAVFAGGARHEAVQRQSDEVLRGAHLRRRGASPEAVPDRREGLQRGDEKRLSWKGSSELIARHINIQKLGLNARIER